MGPALYKMQPGMRGKGWGRRGRRGEGGGGREWEKRCDGLSKISIWPIL